MKLIVKFSCKDETKEGGQLPFSDSCYSIGLKDLDAAREILKDPSIKLEQVELFPGSCILEPITLTEGEARQLPFFKENSRFQSVVPAGSLTQFRKRTYLRGEQGKIIVNITTDRDLLIKTWIETLKNGEKFPPEK